MILIKYFGNGLSELHKELSAVIRKKDKLTQAKELFLGLHAKLHLSVVSDTELNEVDALLNDLLPYEYGIMLIPRMKRSHASDGMV